MHARRRFGLVVLLALGVAVPVGCNSVATVDFSTLPREYNMKVHAPYVVDIPDVLEVTVQPADGAAPQVFRQPVDSTGRVLLGRYGFVDVAGVTLPVAEIVIRDHVGRILAEPTVTVNVVGFHSKKYYVYGQVVRPGVKPWTGRETLLDALGAGITMIASPRRVKIIRPNPKDPLNPTILPVRLDKIVLKGDYSTNYQIEPGDRVWVPPYSIGLIGIWIDNIIWPFRSGASGIGTITNVAE